MLFSPYCVGLEKNGHYHFINMLLEYQYSLLYYDAMNETQGYLCNILTLTKPIHEILAHHSLKSKQAIQFDTWLYSMSGKVHKSQAKLEEVYTEQ
jgi:hypothetical protein